MTIKRKGHYIFGITQNGNKFRPSDWIERIASVFASYDHDNRLRYSPLVMPAFYEDMPCLFVDSLFAAKNPSGCQYILEFVMSNRLQVKTTASVPDSMCLANTQLKDVA